MSRLKSFSIVSLLFLTTLVFISFAKPQSPTKNSVKNASLENEQTMQALLNEVRQLRLAIQRSNLSAHHSQVIIERMRAQRQQVDRLSDRLRGTRDQIPHLKMGQTEHQLELKKIEERISQQTDPGVIGELQERREHHKMRVEFLTQEETRLRENESQLAAQLLIEQAKLAEFNEQLDALQRELEKATR
jgi:chromosome segregation ATPase